MDHAQIIRQHALVFLTDIHTASDLSQLLVLFSKQTLLGDGLRDSLLEHLYNGRLENVVPPTPGRIRLLQHVRPHNLDQPELPFYRLEDALRRAALLDRFDGPHVVNDRLVFKHPRPPEEPGWVIEATKSGVLQSSMYIQTQNGKLQGEKLVKDIQLFLEQARTFCTALHLEEVDAAWYLDGIADATCLVPKEWCPHADFLPGVDLRAPKTIQESQMTRSQLSARAAIATEQQLIQIALYAVRELLYPFSVSDPKTGRPLRAIPKMEFNHATLTASD